MIQKGYKQNFKTLLRAIKDGNAGLMECTDAKTGETVIVICAFQPCDDGMVSAVPMAKLFNANPYEELLPPDLSGPDASTVKGA